jgi:hypothetical protein
MHEGSYAFQIEVSDRAGAKASQQMTIAVAPPAPLGIATQSLAAGRMGARYSVRLEATGGVAPYTWSLTKGDLPAGLALAGETIEGIPTLESTSAFDVEVVDQNGASATLMLKVDAAPPAPPTRLRLQYRNQFLSERSNSIGPQFKIINDGEDAVPISQISIRYYFTMEAPDSLNYWCDWAAVNCANVSAHFIVMGSDRICLELRFTGPGLIPAKASSGDILNRLAKNNWSDFDQSNDYSFSADNTSYADWDHVTIYRDGTLVWGVEP